MTPSPTQSEPKYITFDGNGATVVIPANSQPVIIDIVDAYLGPTDAVNVIRESDRWIITPQDTECFVAVSDKGIIREPHLSSGEVVPYSVGGGTKIVLEYKVELPGDGSLYLMTDGDGEAAELNWHIPIPNAIDADTFVQATSANGATSQQTASAGLQSYNLYQELGDRYAIAVEIISNSRDDQTLWFADCKLRMKDNSLKKCVLTAGEGGTIVTTLPQ